MDDLARGVAIELRIRDKTAAYGKWWSDIKVGAGSLCRGISVVLQNDQREEVGALSMFLERTYYVELARSESRAGLESVGKLFAFEGYEPRFLTASKNPSPSRHVLALGPFDRPEAERVLQDLRGTSSGSVSGGVRIDHGDGYDIW